MFSFLIQNQNKGKRFVTPPFPAFFRQGAGGRLARTARKALAFIGYRSQSHPVGDLRKLCKKRGFRKIPLRGGPHPATRMLSHVFSSGGGRGTVRACRAKGPLLLSDTSHPHVLWGIRGNFAKNVVFTKFRCAAHRLPGGKTAFFPSQTIWVKEGERSGEGHLLSDTSHPHVLWGIRGF